MYLIILYIKIAFWYVTLSGNVCQLSSLNSSEDGVYKSQSKITRAALYWNFTILSSNCGIIGKYVSTGTSKWEG